MKILSCEDFPLYSSTSLQGVVMIFASYLTVIAKV